LNPSLAFVALPKASRFSAGTEGESLCPAPAVVVFLMRLQVSDLSSEADSRPEQILVAG